MPVLELVVDASGVERGSQQAQTALKGVQDSATRTQASVAAVGTNLRQTFQVTQGGVQIATGIAQTAQAFQSLNGAAAGFLGARVLLEIGQTASQMALLRGATTAAGAAFIALGRAIPYIGLALSVATAAYAVFGDRADSATRKIDAQTEAMDRLVKKSRELDRAAAYTPGQKDQRQSPGGTIEALLALRGVSRDTPYYAGDAASLFGISEQDLRYALARTGLGESALELRYPTNLTRGAAPGTSQNPYSMSRFSAGQLVTAGESLLRDRQGQLPVTSQGNTAYDVDQARGMSRSWAAAEQANKEAIAAKQAEVDRAHIAALERQVELAGQFGAAVGAAFYDMLTGAQSFRQAMANIIGSFARQGLSSVTAGLFAATTRQVQGTTNPVGGGAYQ